jgi:hypothetical protein
MGKLGIFDEEQTKWIQFDEDTEIKVRFMGREDLSALYNKSEKAARLSGGDSTNIFNLNLAEKCVLGWRNVYDHNHPGIIVNNSPVAFNPQNRSMLMKRSTEFATFINTTCKDSRLFLEDEIVDKAEDQKNEY